MTDLQRLEHDFKEANPWADDFILSGTGSSLSVTIKKNIGTLYTPSVTEWAVLYIEPVKNGWIRIGFMQIK